MSSSKKNINEMNEEESEMKFTFDETNYAQVLRRKALAEGKAEGKEEGGYMVAKNLLRKGISIDIIAKTTSCLQPVPKYSGPVKLVTKRGGRYGIFVGRVLY